MTDFLEIRLPDNLALAAEGGPQFSTDVITSSSGYEYRNINWSNARAKYNLAPAIQSESELAELVSFFRICKGRAYGFRFKDYSDYFVNNQTIAKGDGNTKVFQLMKTYSLGDIEEVRQIAKPVKDTVNIYIDSKPIAFDCDETNGRIRCHELPKQGAIITADFEFDIPVRFDTDHLSTSLESYADQKDISVFEIKV